MLYINEWTYKQLTERLFPNLKTKLHCQYKSRQPSRYIQVFIPNQDDDCLHYEYHIDSSSWEGYVELHFENDRGKGWNEKYQDLVNDLWNQTKNDESLKWESWGVGFRCRYVKKIDSLEDLEKGLSYMMDLFNPKIEAFTLKQPSKEPKDIPIVDDLAHEQSERVAVYTLTLESVLQQPLSIPNYQRIYCWEEQHVKCLLEDVFNHLETYKKNEVPYRLGTIILHHHDGKYDIIDGQQRLITLSLLLSEMGLLSCLLKEKLYSSQSLEYVAYNKFLIHNFIQHYKKIESEGETILAAIDFNVLVLQNTSLDLAYTFFSNTNSRGVRLTDYDLLKAHHLRYIPSANESQSMLAANVWNKMIEKGRVDEDSSEMPDYARTLDTYMYRLRRWMRKNECDESTNQYRIKREYEAAPVIDEIPPFCERFYFNEPIQGGTHFFSYVEQHLSKYHSFIQREEYLTLHNNMNWSSHLWYRDVIESLLFGYYLKFGEAYLSDALVVIMRIILQHRYDNKQARKASIVRYAGDSELILIIDQATSPTFFLAEARNIAKELSYPNIQEMRPIMHSMKTIATNISGALQENIVVKSFKNLNR